MSVEVTSDALALAYCAGLVDGEGYVGIKKILAKHTNGARRTDGYHATIQVRMVNDEAIIYLAENLGGWTYTEKPHAKYGRLLTNFSISDAKAEIALRALLPYLRVKRGNAEAVLELRDLQATSRQHRTKIVGYRDFPNQYGTSRRVPNKTLSDEYVAECERLWLHCKALNRRGTRGGELVPL